MSLPPTLRHLRAHAVAHSLFPPTTLAAAVERLGFVQADPIRAPARAQDLILRHRADGYCAGELEQRYPSLDVEEDLFYAYGFLPRRVWRLFQPRPAARLSELERGVLAVVREAGATHPRELDARFGRRRVVNAWGGYSQATKKALERLHHHGLLRILRRENGIRIYQPAATPDATRSADERLQELVRVVAAVLAPVPERTLRAIAARLGRRVAADPRSALGELLRAGELERHVVDSVAYLWPVAGRLTDEAPRRVRFLAPFDPLVWDRARFEHFWGWSYRFEAYTPVARRVRGYYALPLLYGDGVIGWANASVVEGELQVEVGFAGRRPTDGAFRRELDEEIARLGSFLRSESASRPRRSTTRATATCYTTRGS
jgi:uncharacterized protein YcaQ